MVLFHAPITDYWAYANRLWLPGSGNVQNVYGTCGECDPNAIIGCTDPLATNMTQMQQLMMGHVTSLLLQ